MPPHPSHLSAVPPLAPEHVADSVSLTVAASAAEVAGVREAVHAVGLRAGLGTTRLADMALAVGEACANAVIHAYAGEERGRLHVTADVVAEGLRVVVADEGRGLAPRPDSPGLGLGLPLMASLTSSLDFRIGPSGGTEIWMVFAGPGAVGAGADWARRSA